MPALPARRGPPRLTTDPGTGAKAIKMSQQDRMRMCNKQATGKKGPERKTFMKSCLSAKKA